MKKFTLDELLNTKKAQKIIDENLSSYNDDDILYAVLEINYWHYDSKIKETIYDFDDLENAIDDIENWKITYYHSLSDYHDSCDDLIEFWNNEMLERYFDFESYHDDCDYDITEASNWVVIWNW